MMVSPSSTAGLDFAKEVARSTGMMLNAPTRMSTSGVQRKEAPLERSGGLAFIRLL